MQEPTHILAGVIIQKCFTWRKSRALALSLRAVLAFTLPTASSIKSPTSPTTRPRLIFTIRFG